MSTIVRCARRRPCRNGYALVVVLWIVTLLATVTMSYHASTHVEARLVAETLYRARAEAAAEAGLWATLQSSLRVRDGLPSGRAPVVETVEMNGVVVEVTISDEAGRINLNRAQGELLEAALGETGVPEAESEALVAAILDWRDADDEARDLGAEDREYEALGAGYTTKNGFFSTTDELRYVRGMTDAIFRKIEPLVTVYGTHSRVNLSAASRAVIEALPGASAETANAIVADREVDGTVDGHSIAAINRRFVQGGGSDIFRVRAKTTLGDVTVVLSPIIHIPRRGMRRLNILAWSDELG